MTVEQIIKAVRFCFDEEVSNNASFSSPSAGDISSMNNIIKSKIGDALRWICLYAPAELLEGSDGSDTTGIMVDETNAIPTPITGTSGGRITLGADANKKFVKLVRIRMQDWHRAIKNPISEDSEEYLQLYDDSGATATADRPQAVLIEKAVKEFEVWPFNAGKTAEYTYIADPGTAITETSTDNETLPLPPKVKTAFIYYLAFLVLAAYEDSRAARMLEIAKMNIGK
jgi:hypothetical protein